MIEYPYFADIRRDGFNQENPITANLAQATMAWSSPIIVDQQKNRERKITELLRSSDKSWLSDNTEIMPEIDEQGMTSFKREGEFGSHLLGVISEGKFKSYFAGKESPFVKEQNRSLLPDDNDTDEEESQDATAVTDTAVIAESPDSSRIILFSSNDFLRDQTLLIANSAVGSEYLSSMELIANTIDWSLEDSGLLSIRSRGHFNRTLPPMEQSAQMFWEYLNYVLAAMAIAVVALWERRKRAARNKQYLELLAA